MRTIVHLSDMHFGRFDQRLVAPLVRTVQRIAPDLVAISGDLTQRARRSQFAQARAFLDRLPTPRLVVPGNHDVPLFNLAALEAQNELPMLNRRAPDQNTYFCGSYFKYAFHEDAFVSALNVCRSIIGDTTLWEEAIHT